MPVTQRPYLQAEPPVAGHITGTPWPAVRASPGVYCLWRPRHVVEWRSGRDERLAVDALLVGLQQLAEVEYRPCVQVAGVVRFAFLRIDQQIDDVQETLARGRQLVRR